MRIILLGLILCVEVPLMAEEPVKEVGRFVVKTVDYESRGTGDRDLTTTSKMLIKVDTLTGKIWQYRAFAIINNGKVTLSQYAWVPMVDEPEDIVVALRKAQEAK